MPDRYAWQVSIALWIFVGLMVAFLRYMDIRYLLLVFPGNHSRQHPFANDCYRPATIAGLTTVIEADKDNDEAVMDPSAHSVHPKRTEIEAVA